MHFRLEQGVVKENLKMVVLILIVNSMPIANRDPAQECDYSTATHTKTNHYA